MSEPDPATEPASVSRPVRTAAGVLVVICLGLIGWRWWADFRGHRPADLGEAPLVRVDLNRATKSELMQLPGVGPAMAERIVRHRELAGQFQNADDLKRVQGFGDTTFRKVRPWIVVELSEDDSPQVEPEKLVRKVKPPEKTVSKPETRRVKINRATPDELNALPGIGPVLAQRIIDERARKPFADPADLRRVSGLGPKRIEQLADLLDFATE
jgi:competence protein ComEA